MLKEIKFGSEAITHIRSCLAEGNTLSTYLLGLPLEDGSVTVYLPTTVSAVAIRRFEMGGVAKISETEPRLLAFIDAYLGGRGKRYAVFETLGRSGDPFLSSLKERFFIYGSEIYYFLTSRDCERERIKDVVRSARHYPFVGVLTPMLEDDQDIQVGHKVVKDVLERLAARTEHVLIGAYDSEAVLIWSKS